MLAQKSLTHGERPSLGPTETSTFAELDTDSRPNLYAFSSFSMTRVHLHDLNLYNQIVRSIFWKQAIHLTEDKVAGKGTLDTGTYRRFDLDDRAIICLVGARHL